MSLEAIVCPKCSFSFPASAAFSSEIDKQVSTAKREAENRLAKEFSDKEKTLSKKLAEKDSQLTELNSLVESERSSLANQRRDLERVAEERAVEIAKEKESSILARAKSNFELELTDKDKQLQEQTTKLEEFRKSLLDLKKENRTLEEQKKDNELLVQKQITEAARAAEESAGAKIHESYALKEAEHEKQLKDFKNKLDEAQRKLEQKSQQAQGEILEAELEEQLRTVFRTDEIEEVAKGVSGADIHQKVVHSGVERGLILWEAKNTKSWSNGWITNLKDNQSKSSADVAILVTNTLPKGAKRISEIDGVWVCDFPSAVLVGQLLRRGLIEVHSARCFAEGKGTKMEDVYNYLTGAKFKNRIETIVDTFQSMKDALNREQLAMSKNWKVRATQIDRVIENTVNMYGDLQGIAGKQLPVIPALELEQIEEVPVEF